MGNKESSSGRKTNSSKRSLKKKNGVTGESKLLKSRVLDALNEDLREAFLLEEDRDVTIKVGDEKYSFIARSFILKHRSPVFKEILKRDILQRNKHTTIDIPDCDPSKFRDFLFYLSTGKLDYITKENAFDLYHLSDKYKVKQLKKDCIDYFLKNLNADIICDVILLATTHSQRHLLIYATQFFIANVKDILPTPYWQKFITENPLQANKLIIKAFNIETRL